MKVFKRVIGFILVVVASILSFSTVIILVKAIFIDCVNELKKSIPEGLGYSFGTLVVGTLLMLLTRYLFTKGLKLLITENAQVESVEDIGKLQSP